MKVTNILKRGSLKGITVRVYSQRPDSISRSFTIGCDGDLEQLNTKIEGIFNKIRKKFK